MEFMKYIVDLFWAVLLVLPFFIVSKQLSASPSKQKKAKQQAIEKGHVITAKLIKSHGPRLSDNKGSLDKLDCGTYQYEYRGKTYYYRAYFNDLPGELTLYFLHDPKKAAMEGHIVLKQTPWPIIFIVAYLLIIFVFG